MVKIGLDVRLPEGLMAAVWRETKEEEVEEILGDGEGTKEG